MVEKLAAELEALHAQGLTELKCAAKWLELLTAHVAALEVHREQDRNELMSHAGRLAALETYCGAQLKTDHDALAREVNTEVIVGQEMDIQRLRAENATLKEKVDMLAERLRVSAERYADMAQRAQWPTPQPIETAPCETVILAYDAEYKVWEKMYTRRTSPAVRAKKRYPVWLPMPPPPGGGK